MKTFLWIIAFLNALLIGAAIRENRKPNADFEGASGYMDIFAFVGCVLLDVIALAVYFIAKLF